MSKNFFLIFVFILFLIRASSVYSFSLSVSPSSVDMSKCNNSNLRIFNTNQFPIRISLSSPSYYLDSANLEVVEIKPNTYRLVNISKKTCVDSYVVLRIISSDGGKTSILPSLKVGVFCSENQTLKLDASTSSDPFIGIIIVLSIVAVSLFIKLIVF